jgi:hypothetical protein
VFNQNIESDVTLGVTKVRWPVNGRTANINADMPGFYWFEFFFLTGE